MLKADMSKPQARTVLGAYGFALLGLEDSAPQLLAADPSWPLLAVVRTGPTHEAKHAPRPPGTIAIRADDAEIWLAEGDRIVVDREAREVRFETSERFSDAVVLHPYLAFPASIHSRWLGRFGLHGGAFRHDGRTVALLGPKEAGKSSTLAWLLQHGHEIVSDDVLILDGLTLFAGPRCVDLREESAAVLGGEALGVVGSRGRWRLQPGDVPPAGPLDAVVHLEWGDDVRVGPVEPGARLAALVDNSVLRPGNEVALELLELASLPTWRFERPRDLGRLDDAGAALLSALS
jgi:hypothetical protein